MKRRVAALFLAVCILFCMVPAQAAGGVCFIAVNDTLLKLGSSAYVQGSTVYVPYNVFETFGIYHSYYSAGSTATVYTGALQIYFELDSGNTYDGSDNYYSTSALMRGSTVYVSVSFICMQFGLTWSYLGDSEYGDVCRIKDGGAILSDTQFLSAADSLMESRYNEYMGISTPGVTPPTETSIPDPSDNRDVYLSFQGLPSDALLDTLTSSAVSTTFFLTADDILASPETLCRIIADGHGVGVLCSGSPLDEFERASGLIFETARIKTLLIAAASPDYNDACRSAAAENGLVFWPYDIDGILDGDGVKFSAQITAALSFSTERSDVRLLCCDSTDGSLSTLLHFIKNGNYTLHRPREVGAPS